MQITLTILADSPDELRDALTAVIVGLPAKVASAPMTDYAVTATPAPAVPDVKDIAAKPSTRKTAKSKSDAEPIAETKTIPAQQRAAEEAALKAVAAPAVAASVMTDAQAKSAALDILRECFALETTEGGAEGAKLVKKLMAEMGVDKFVKVPEAQGNTLYTKALAVKQVLTGSAEEPQDAAQDPEPEPEDTVELAF